MKSSSQTEGPSLRQLAIIGEKAMVKAQEEGQMIIEAHSSELIRTYAASGLLMAALEELQDGVARDSAVDILREALVAMRAMPS